MIQISRKFDCSRSRQTSRGGTVWPLNSGEPSYDSIYSRLSLRESSATLNGLLQNAWLKIDGGFNLLAVSLLGLLVGSMIGTVDAQIIIRDRIVFGDRDDADAARVLAALHGLDPGDQADFGDLDLAPLRTDPELESILEKAKRFQDDGNYRVATKLMQTVLERSGDTLFSDDEQIYFSLVRQVEQQLAALPAEGLAAYRLEADAEAGAIISAGEQGDLEYALNQVVNRYFISSVGDETAVRLGRLYLDQYDFVSARRVFEKALQHPDLSIDKNQIMSHVALCDLFLNDLKSADQSTQQLLASEPNLRLARLVADEIDEIQSGKGSIKPVQRNRTAGWEMPLASSTRYGVGLPVGERMLCDQLVASFQFYFDPSISYSKSNKFVGNVLSGESAYGKNVAETQGAVETRMIASRRKHGWRPTGMLLFGPDQVYVKTARDMVALKKSELPLGVEGSLASVLDSSMTSWRSLWKNVFEIDKGTAKQSGLVDRFGRLRPRQGAATKVDNKTPKSIPEVQTYGDTIAAQFSIYNNVLYSIEGKRDDGKAGPISQRRRSFNYGQSFNRTRNNFLVAYDLDQEGKVLWTLPVMGDKVGQLSLGGEPEEEKFLARGGLMGAPVGYQNTIIAPVNINGSIWIYGLDPNAGGQTLWKSHLCDEPATGANAWTAINLSVDGSDVMVSCGLGVVFVLDAATGQIRIARRYQRDGNPHLVLGSPRWRGVKKVDFSKGWTSDTIIPYGRQMICFCSDAKVIEAIDRETGKTLWKSDFNLISRKLDYLLGVYDGVLYAAGPETIAAFDLNARQHIWGGDDLFGKGISCGRGLLTPQGIFVPVGDQILQFDLMPKELNTQPKPTREISVDLGGADVGNLFSDGDRFWVHGGNRIYALEAKPE